jgi:excisionase family DNA binding protein
MNDNLINSKQVLTLDETVRYTGFKRSYLYKMTSQGKIPFYKPNGKMIYFDRIELENWLKRNRSASENEIEEKAISYLNSKK